MERPTLVRPTAALAALALLLAPLAATAAAQEAAQEAPPAEAAPETFTAPPANSQIVFVDSQAAIAAHPNGEQAAEVQRQARADLEPLRAELEGLAQIVREGGELDAAQRERYQLLLASIQEVQNRAIQEADQAAGPAIQAVNDAIRRIAQENGYSIVLDLNVAGTQGTNLVVYADDGLDITPLVIEAVRGAQ